MNPRLFATVLLLGAVAAAACPPNVRASAPAMEPAATESRALGIDPAAMDPSVDPGDDFYAYANGTWLKTAEIPPDRPSIGGFVIADQATEQQLEQLIAELLAREPQPGSGAERIRRYYQAFVDTAAIDAAGMAPIRRDLDRILAIGDKRQLAAAIGATIRADVDPLNATDFHTENPGSSSPRRWPSRR